MNTISTIEVRKQLQPRVSFLLLVFFVTLLTFFGLLLFSVIPKYQATGSQVEIVFMDVGQGDATLVQVKTPALFTDTQLLVDGGPNRMVLNGLGQVSPLFDRVVEYVIATHPDADHIGGLIPVLERYKVETVIQNSDVSDTPVYQEYSKQVSQASQVFDDRSVQSIQLGPETFVTILPVPVLSSDRNDNSVITRIDHGSTSVLLTGDASVEVEAYLIENFAILLDVDILKLGHHGSRTATSLGFLNTTSPEVVVISAPLDGRYGHPHQEVIDNLKQYRQAEIYWTGTDGVITVNSTDGGNVYDVTTQF